MTPPAAQHPTLHLTGAQPMRGRHDRAAARRIAQANRSAADLPPDDARLVFASEVASAIQGGRAAVLTPERRRELTRLAQRLGMRPFDASLIIAIVQDDARSGSAGASDAVRSALSLIGRPGDRRAPWVSMLTAVALAALALWALIAWATR